MPSDHISVCICTYKRPDLLVRLLASLEDQAADNLFSFSILVVDNDSQQSARSAVLDAQTKSKVAVRYAVEPEQNIALARNKAIQSATGDYIAFIDDDEFPADRWLLNLYTTCKKFKADGVLGPVKPYFEVEPPEWILKGKLLERKTYRTGTTMSKARDTRTGNVLLDVRMLLGQSPHFDRRFGKTGGEDVDFFRRKMAEGRRFVWCNEAPVFEANPFERLRRRYFLRRALLRGLVASRRERFSIFHTLQSIAAFLIYTSLLPVLILMGHHWFMKFLIKDCDHIGKILGMLGINPVRERDF